MMTNNELCVPTSSVAAHGDDESQEAVEPAVGDTVEVTVSGKVSRVENGQVYLTPDTANGEPIAGNKPEGADSMGEDTPESIDKMMAEASEGMGY